MKPDDVARMFLWKTNHVQALLTHQKAMIICLPICTQMFVCYCLLPEPWMCGAWLAFELWPDGVSYLLLQLPREWRDSVAQQGCPSPSPYSVPVAPAGTGNGCHGQLQSRWPQGAWLLVRCWDPEKKGDSHSERDLCQDSPWVSCLGPQYQGHRCYFSAVIASIHAKADCG